MTARIMTVSGPVDPDAMGITLPHEHIIVDLRHSLYGFDTILDDVPLAITELQFLKDAGGDAVVDVTNGCMGRDAQAQARIAQETGLKIIAATGYYTEPYYPREVYELSTDRLADLMVAELTEGIDGTEVRAGIIGEIGTRRDFMSPAEERVFRAASRAQLRTGVAISTHTYLEQLIPDQLGIFEDEGVQPGRVIIGHLVDHRDMDRLRAIAAKGVYLQIDHIGFEVQQRDRQRAKTVAELIKDGHVSQLLLSMDLCAKSRLHWHDGHGYDYMLAGFAPLLAEEGVSQSEIDTMMIDNPRRALAYEV